MKIAWHTAGMDVEQSLKSSGEGERLGQSFVAARDAPVEQVVLHLRKVGSPGGFVYAELYDDDEQTLIENGQSDPVLCNDIDDEAEWVKFEFDKNMRPSLHGGQTHYIVLRSSGYTYSSGTYVSWTGDSFGRYLKGQGRIYNSGFWYPLASDFNFALYSGHRDTYITISDVEGIVRAQTDNGKFTDTSVPSAATVMDFIDKICDEMDTVLKAHGISVPLTTPEGIGLVRSYAMYGVAMLVEMSMASGGFRAEESADTRAGAFRVLYNEFKKQVESGSLVNALIDAGELETASATGLGLTAGGVEIEDRRSYREDKTLVKPSFETEMWDNKYG